MKVNIEQELSVSAKVVFRDGELNASVAVGAPYTPPGMAERYANVTGLLTDDDIKAIEDILSPIIAERVQELVPKAQAAAHQAYLVAVERDVEVSA